MCWLLIGARAFSSEDDQQHADREPITDADDMQPDEEEEEEGEDLIGEGMEEYVLFYVVVCLGLWIDCLWMMCGDQGLPRHSAP